MEWGNCRNVPIHGKSEVGRLTVLPQKLFTKLLIEKCEGGIEPHSIPPILAFYVCYYSNLYWVMTNKSKLPGKIIISSIFLDIQAKNKDEPKAQILVITGVWAFLFCPTRCAFCSTLVICSHFCEDFLGRL